MPSRPPRPARRQLVPVIGTLLLGPVVIALQTARGEPVPLLITLVASALVPLLIAAQLLHQVRERATAEHRAEHDPLTGLPNRVLFHDRVDVAVAHAKRNGTGFAVMFLDLDRFKSINDSLGHAVGDQLLQAVAKKLRRTLREDDTVARMGGDEFTLLIPETAHHRDYERVAEKVLRAFGEPFLVGVRQLSATTSIGIATYPADGADSRTLLKNADTAMYRAKTKGRNTCQLGRDPRQPQPSRAELLDHNR